MATVAFVSLSGCGSDPTAGSSGGGSRATVSSDAAAGAGEGGNNGEAAGIRFVSDRYHYRVDAPGTMREAADGTATAQRGVEQLTIKVVAGPAAADPSAFAQADLGQVRPRSPQFSTIAGPATTALSGRSVAKVVYSWTNGANPVTGKPEQLTTARYYIPRDSSTLAVVTYSISASQYDPQGADDVVATFQWQ